MNFFLMLATYFLAVNAITYFLFALDKRRAIQNEWRIPEQKLLAWAFLGGWPAAKIAQRRLRHKTRKQPFGLLLNLMCGLNLIAISLLGFLVLNNHEIASAIRSTMAAAPVFSQPDAPDPKPRPVVRRLATW